MEIVYRLFNSDTDYPRRAEIINRTARNQSPMTADRLRAIDLEQPSDLFQQLIVATDGNRHMLGFSRILQPPWYSAGDMYQVIRVDPEFQRRGIGTGLYERLLTAARQTQTKRLFADVADYLPDELVFAERRGFQIDRHMFESRLDVANFDETPFAKVVDTVSMTGITFTTLAALGDTPENRQKLYELHQRLATDVPGDEHPTFASLESFELSLLPNSRALPEAVILALADDQWIGFTALTSFGDPNTLNHFMTGVNRHFRGRNLAMAMKLLSIQYAKLHSIRYLETNNDSTNAPMLAINAKLGYQRLRGVYTLIKSLS